MPKVSVIMPVYNVEPYLGRCLDSLIHQTLSDIEIVCVDDCSTDGSLRVLNEWAAKDVRIKVITSSQNGGAAVARNKGLDVAQGQYLGFVDPDDFIDLCYYEKLYNKAEETGADIVKCVRKIVAKDGQITISLLNDVIRKKGKFQFAYEWQCGLYKASLIFDNHIRFIPEIIKAQDIVFQNAVVLKANKLELIDDAFYYHCMREGSLDAHQISLDKIKSALLAVGYILKGYNDALDKEMPKEKYVALYVSRLNTILARTILQNNSEEAKKLCVEKYIELFHKNLMPTEVEAYYRQFNWTLALEYAKNRDYSGMFNLISKYKNFDKYSMHMAVGRLRSNVRTELENNQHKTGGET